jgi:hypothetical protein
VTAIGSSADAGQYDAAVDWVIAYDIRLDEARVRQIQQATLSPGFGLVPEPALFGSDDLWRAVGDGRVEALIEEGHITRVWWGTMGDWPLWSFRSSDGPESEWTREGDHTRYVEGLRARITTVLVRWKEDSQLVQMGQPAAHRMLIKVELEDSAARSALSGPGPFSAKP